MAPRNTAKIQSDLKRAAQRVAKAAPIFSRKVVQKAYTIGAPKKTDTPKGMSVKQLARAVPEFVTRAAVNGNVEVIRQQRRKTTKGLAYWFMTSTSEKGLSRTHTQIVREKDKSQRLVDSKQVSVECDCGMFKYYCDYALYKKGASDLKHSIDEPPTEKNPRMEPWSCKHLKVVYIAIEEGRL
jgi:hypothetical protein